MKNSLFAIRNLINKKQDKSSSIPSSYKIFQVDATPNLSLAFRSGMAEAISKTIASIEAATTVLSVPVVVVNGIHHFMLI